MKITRFAIAFLLLAATFCIGQNAPGHEVSDANQSAPQPTTGAGHTPEQAPPPANPPAAQPAPPADQGSSQDKDNKNEDGRSSGTSSGTSKDRLFFALPNFLSVEQKSGEIPPLTAGQKFKVVARGSFDPVQIVWYGALSGISQAENSEPGYGQGAEGYGKRYGAYAADGTIENFFVGAILPSVLRQDPRFFPTTEGSFFSRSRYAVSRIVVTRGDSGQSQFNFSEVFGSAMSAAISTYSYHPHPGYHPGQTGPYVASDRTLKNTASVWGSQVGYDTITLVIKEFWPDIRRKLEKQH